MRPVVDSGEREPGRADDTLFYYHLYIYIFIIYVLRHTAGELQCPAIRFPAAAATESSTMRRRR